MTTCKTNKQQLSSPNNDDPTSNMIKLLRDLIGYDYYSSRAAFDYHGTEIAFVNEGLVSRIHIYVDGEHKRSRRTCGSTIRSNTSFEHNGDQYRVASHSAGWFQSAQVVSLYVNEIEVDKKYDRGLAGLSWKQRIHFVFGAALMGAAIGLVLKSVI